MRQQPDDETKGMLQFMILRYIAIGIFLMWLSYSAFPAVTRWLMIVVGGVI